MTKYKPAQCHFGLTINFEGISSDGSDVGILLSVPHGAGDRYARDDVDEDMIEDFPAWLRDRCEAEAFYLAPDGWSREKTKLELEKIGFIHNATWDADYGA